MKLSGAGAGVKEVMKLRGAGGEAGVKSNETYGDDVKISNEN